MGIPISNSFVVFEVLTRPTSSSLFQVWKGKKKKKEKTDNPSRERAQIVSHALSLCLNPRAISLPAC